MTLRLTPDEQDYIDQMRLRQGDDAAEDAVRKVMRLRHDFMAVLGSEQGQRVLWWMLQQCNVFKTTMTGNAWSNFHEGQRSIGLMLLSQIVASDHDKWLEMQRYHVESLLNDLNSTPER